MATSVSETLATIGTLFILHRLIGRLSWGRVLSAPLAAAVPTALVMLVLRSAPVVSAAAGAVVYVGVLVAVERLRHPDDLRALADMARRRT